MASVRKRGGKWQVQVRTNGHTATKTFINKTDALRWSREIERKADQGDLVPDRSLLRSTTLADVLTRYRDEVVPRKKAGKNEACMISGIMRCDAKLVATTLDKLDSYQFSDWRDKRLRTMQPSSVCRYLGLIASSPTNRSSASSAARCTNVSRRKLRAAQINADCCAVHIRQQGRFADFCCAWL